MTVRNLAPLVLLMVLAAIPAYPAFISAGIGVADFGAPSNFGFVFGTPYVGGPFDASALSYELTVTDGGRDGAAITGTVEGKVDGVLATSLTINCSVPGGELGGSTTCSDSISQLFASPAAGFLELHISFGLSGDGDSVAIQARHELLNSGVPEPSAIWMCASGCAVLGALRWRRRRT